MIERLLPNASQMGDDFIQATIESLQMIVSAMIIAGVLGLLLGIVLLVTGEHGLRPNKVIYWTLDQIVNIGRSIPFIILLAIIMPFTRFVVGTSIGTTAVTVPIVVGTIPFFARQVQNALLEVDPGVVEAAKAMGTSDFGIVYRVYLREGLVSLIRSASFTIINLIGLTAMAGIVGGGGLGATALQQGYQRGQTDVTFASMVLILIIVFITQIIGNIAARIASHGRG
ncbi:methionine ABC transporter permease [Bifidobacterium sp.]|jgi:D-methionine transport system permease protein|uniref:methionine ABC transporter permease n=1 Tax=Bifidobacterium sp. TaxID=41200 RepID=UPI0025BB5A21|nr:methionine ABC transporter permease [Bifidobacterium sp.]MCH4159962.1 ABC transporter permease [Bifidobacterium sp.]MCH4175158.1 ABC transporter permease [Bifidobacterium sp.]MCI1635508.1 ABC transporter permease [Bifidobacterium sp.]